MFLVTSGGHIGEPKRCTNMASPHTKLYKGVGNVSANNSETVGNKDLRRGQIVQKLVFYNISFSWLLPLDGFQFIFLLRDSEITPFTILRYMVITSWGKYQVHWYPTSPKQASVEDTIIIAGTRQKAGVKKRSNITN